MNPFINGTPYEDGTPIKREGYDERESVSGGEACFILPYFLGAMESCLILLVGSLVLEGKEKPILARVPRGKTYGPVRLIVSCHFKAC